MSQQPKILIGCPTCDLYAYCIDEYIERIKEIDYNNFDLLLVDNSKDKQYYKILKKKGINVIKDEYQEPAIKRIVNSRNILRKFTIKKNYDYFLSLEQDVIPPKDIIEQLLKHNKKVISAVVFNKYKNQLLPMIWKEKEELIEFYKPEELEPRRLEKIRTASLSCMLIHKDILKEIEFRYEKEQKCFDDMFFCNDLKGKKISLHCDTGIKCIHKIKNKSWKDIEKF